MNDLIQGFVDIIKNRYNIKIEKWEPNKNYYPEYMLLSGDRGILAYIYFMDNNTVSTNDILKKVSRAESELDRPVFFIRNFYDLSKLYFETNEQIKDRLLEGYTDNLYKPDMDTVGDFDELIAIFKELKKSGAKFH